MDGRSNGETAFAGCLLIDYFTPRLPSISSRSLGQFRDDKVRAALQLVDDRGSCWSCRGALRYLLRRQIGKHILMATTDDIGCG